MKRILIFIFLFSMLGVALADDMENYYQPGNLQTNVIRIAVVHSYDLDNFNDVHLDNMMVGALKEIVEDVQMKRYFLGENELSTEVEFQSKANKVWESLLLFSPDRLVIIGNHAYLALKDNLQTFNKPIGLFDIRISKMITLESVTENENPVFVSFNSISILPFIKYLAKNGVDVRSFYIIRDSTQEMLEIENKIREEVYTQNPRADIRSYIAHSVQDLRAIIADTQIRKKGILIVLTNSLPNYDNGTRSSLSAISKEIRRMNIRQIELNLIYDAMDDGIAFSYSHLHRECRQSKRFALNPLSIFLEDYNSKRNVLIETQSRLTVNGKRVKELGIEKALQDFTSVHCFKDSY